MPTEISAPRYPRDFCLGLIFYFMYASNSLHEECPIRVCMYKSAPSVFLGECAPFLNSQLYKAEHTLEGFRDNSQIIL